MSYAVHMRSTQTVCADAKIRHRVEGVPFLRDIITAPRLADHVSRSDRSVTVSRCRGQSNLKVACGSDRTPFFSFFFFLFSFLVVGVGNRG